MASSKPDILLILLQKLMEEGNLLYKVCCGLRLWQREHLFICKKREVFYIYKDFHFDSLSSLRPRHCPLCFSERTYEGGRPALPVRPEEASSRGARRGAEGAQGPAGLPLPKPLPVPQENQRKLRWCIEPLMHYLPPAGLLDAEGMAGGLARRDRRLLKIYNSSVSR